MRPTFVFTPPATYVSFVPSRQTTMFLLMLGSLLDGCAEIIQTSAAFRAYFDRAPARFPSSPGPSRRARRRSDGHAHQPPAGDRLRRRLARRGTADRLARAREELLRARRDERVALDARRRHHRAGDAGVCRERDDDRGSAGNVVV